MLIADLGTALMLGMLAAAGGEGAELSDQVELSDTQEGFVGRSGEVVVIEPTGQWTRSKFVNQAKDPHARGKLDSSRMAQLVAAIKVARFDSLPEQMGRDVAVNRHLITVKTGQRTVTVSLRGGEPLENALGESKTWDRLLKLAIVIDELTTPDETFVRVEVRGTLAGLELKTRELKFSIDPGGLKLELDALQGKLVDARGRLRRGAEGGLILRVTDIRAARPAKQ